MSCRPQALQHCMHAVLQHLASEQLQLFQGCQAARTALQTAQSRLQLELSSAGNIWLEEGGPGEAWVQSCQELVRGSSCGPAAWQVSTSHTFLVGRRQLANQPAGLLHAISSFSTQ
jgi:hypothetical protein